VRSFAEEVPPAIALVVDRAIAKARTSRFPSMRDLAEAIEAAVPTPTRTTTLLGPPPLPKAETPAEQQRRRAKRAPYSTPVQLVLPGGQTLDGRTEDISEGGLLVLSHAPCKADQRVAVRLALPMEGKVVSVDAHARWVRAAAGPHAPGVCAIGLEFVDLPAAARASIARYVSLMADRNQT